MRVGFKTLNNYKNKKSIDYNKIIKKFLGKMLEDYRKKIKTLKNKNNGKNITDKHFYAKNRKLLKECHYETQRLNDCFLFLKNKLDRNSSNYNYCIQFIMNLALFIKNEEMVEVHNTFENFKKSIDM